ncbi:lipoyl synthase [Pseudodesulfovibrio piezophilus]|uniref:Lipoyl synthase n=1 Tax=Pseudodesulfovibrio piezophilus (strain DSM 21447 / JCM 15486 / C1TLV30) TaxID=1322246 RepID=M1WKY5_PSEP2|nr:lipoyl synthase [Pseudodesulfovibrio piezophilus]CCH50406.1 Lipoyl synthase [Pseudodesulfovibrio piezophilus C1TLV30]
MIKPRWLVLPAPDAHDMNRIQDILDKGQLHSVCESAQCPNIGECFAHKTCTFMILGDICTRNCAFCAVAHGHPLSPDPQEPGMVGETARQLGLKHVVVTSVTRDDLPDGGAEHFVATIQAIKHENPDATVEVLIPDFGGRREPLESVLSAMPDVLNHNIETVPRLYDSVRPGARYERSLQLIRNVSNSRSDERILTKSGLMLGLGETQEEVVATMEDLLQVGCRIVTLGQYLCPSSRHHPVVEYVHPDTFNRLADIGKQLGFKQVVAGPLVRSSYHAAESFKELRM